MKDEHPNAKQRVFSESKKLFWTTLYLWILLSLFVIHKSVVLKEQNIFFHQGFALINALALAKVILVADMVHVKGWRMPLAYLVLLKSAIFSLILICFHVLEDGLIGMWHGKGFVESIHGFGAGHLQDILAVGAILFVCLIPFFALKEVASRVGSEKLYNLFFSRDG